MPRPPRCPARRAIPGVRFLSEEEEARLLALLRHWGKDDVADVVAVLLDTGLRHSELWALTPADVSLPLNRLMVRRARHVGGQVVQRTKNGAARMIPMTARVRQIIERRMGESLDYLFPYDNAWLRAAWDRAREHLGLSGDPNFVPYICRHTCASRLVQRGVPLPVVKEWLGHKTLSVTLRYAHLAPSMFDDALKALERASPGRVG